MVPLGDCMYAGRKRRKPIQKHKSTLTSVKSNPSKRHRDRLNTELDHLASLLPFSPDIISKLDKLSVLRLSVSYLRVKSFFKALEDSQLRKQPQHLLTYRTQDNPSTALIQNLSVEGEHLLDHLMPLVSVSSTDGYCFFHGRNVPVKRFTMFVTDCTGINREEVAVAFMRPFPELWVSAAEGLVLAKNFHIPLNPLHIPAPQALDGMVLLVSADGMIFYVSPTIIDYLGFHQTDVMQQSVYDFIHVDDRQEFQSQMHWAMNPPQQASGQDPLSQGANDEHLAPIKVCDPKVLPPEFSPFLNRCFVIRMRCLLDSTSGFLTMQFQGRLKYLQGQRKKDRSGVALPPQLGLFCIAVPLLLPSISEIKLKSLLLKTKHRLDLSPVTIDAKAKAIAEWSDSEHRSRSGCHYLHFTDMLCHAENQIRMMNTGENGLTVFRVLTKGGQWVWIQANRHLPYRNKLAEYATVPQGELKDTERTKEEHLRNPPGTDQSGNANEFVYNNCSDISLPSKQLYEQSSTKEGREEKYESVGNHGDIRQNEPLNFCTSFSRPSKVSIADNLWVSEYSRGPSNLQPVGRTNNDLARVAKGFCGRRLGLEPELRDNAQASSFQNTVQNFRAIGDKMQQSQLFDLHSTVLEGYPAHSYKSEGASAMGNPISYRSKDLPLEYCSSMEMFHGVQIKSEYNVELQNRPGGSLESPGQPWVHSEVGKRMAANMTGQSQLKCDPNALEQLSPCEKLKPLPPAPFCGASAVKSSGRWMVSSACNHNRPSRQGMDMVHFSPQKDTHSSCSQPADSLQALAFPHHVIQDKGPGRAEYKAPMPFKGHDLIRTVIKREPTPSPPWSCDSLHDVQEGLEKNMPSCLINSLTHKITQNAYL